MKSIINRNNVWLRSKAVKTSNTLGSKHQILFFSNRICIFKSPNQNIHWILKKVLRNCISQHFLLATIRFLVAWNSILNLWFLKTHILNFNTLTCFLHYPKSINVQTKFITACRPYLFAEEKSATRLKNNSKILLDMFPIQILAWRGRCSFQYSEHSSFFRIKIWTKFKPTETFDFANRMNCQFNFGLVGTSPCESRVHSMSTVSTFYCIERTRIFWHHTYIYWRQSIARNATRRVYAKRVVWTSVWIPNRVVCWKKKK